MLNIGQSLLGGTPPFVNPFLQVDPAQNSGDTSPTVETPQYGPMGAPAPQTGPGAAAPAAEGNHPWKNYVGGWKNFIGSFKTNPDMRVALLQTLLSMTQPDSTMSASIGRGLNAGVGTLQALGNQREQQQMRQFQMGQEERKTAVAEGGLKTEQAGQAQKANEFGVTSGIQQQNATTEAKRATDEAGYHKDQIAVEREKIAAGGEAGPVMKQWGELTNLVQQLNPGLTPAQAKATAWDIKQSAGKMPRSQLKAQIMSQNQIMLPTRNKGESDQAFGERMRGAIQQQSDQMDKILDASGYDNPTSFGTMPGMQPGAAAPPPNAQNVPKPQTAQERDALAPGTIYQAPDGSFKTR